MNNQSIQLYLNTRPQPREGIAFATKYGWAVPNCFDNKGFSISYEIFGLDQILYENFLTSEGNEIVSNEVDKYVPKYWAETVNKYGFEHFSPLVVFGVEDFNSQPQTFVEEKFIPQETVQLQSEFPGALPVMPEDMVHGDLPSGADLIPTPPAHLIPTQNVESDEESYWPTETTESETKVEVETEVEQPTETEEVVEQTEVEQPTETEEVTKYTFDQLMAMEMEEVREIGNSFGVKDKSKERLANKIIEKQG
ncbi:hypothetical protein Kuja_1340 [Vibrio phage vB_VchM_Kuja]|uniref:Uncharacterized protein n=1 Tax=Vibrio phage vB_VchM_Kuja TaxID=2686437 RepID=A0A6B9J5J8_9CAUD|nr:hypothetical protein HWC83_gp102 [Vibrio phage vB_VchM_Kuja]QGZ16125.1 hypothetical protein Kuja_1340 [Vibrio phage vB_VchM_Kuja]